MKEGGAIDDKQFRDKDHEKVQTAAVASAKYHRESGQELEVTNSTSWCTCHKTWGGAPPLTMNEQPIKWVDMDKVLGVENQYTNARMRPEQQKRSQSALDATERLSRLPVGSALKDLLAAVALLTK